MNSQIVCVLTRLKNKKFQTKVQNSNYKTFALRFATCHTWKNRNFLQKNKTKTTQ